MAAKPLIQRPVPSGNCEIFLESLDLFCKLGAVQLHQGLPGAAAGFLLVVKQPHADSILFRRDQTRENKTLQAAVLAGYRQTFLHLRQLVEAGGRALPLFFEGSKAGLRKRDEPAFPSYVSYFLFFLVSFWGGFFGGGTGIFATYVLIFGFNQTFLEAAGTRKVPGMVLVCLPLALFALSGLVDWLPGLALMAGTAIGSYLGAGHGMRKGDGWVRGLFMVVAIVSALKLIL